MTMKQRLPVVVSAAVLALGVAACGGGPSYSTDDLDSAFTTCNFGVAVNGAGTSAGPNAAIVDCMQDEVDGLSFDAGKKYLQKREKNDDFLTDSP